MQKPPYTLKPSNVKKFFQKMQAIGTPSKVNEPYLKTIGFTSSSDRYLPGVLKFLGFIDKANVPTEKWNTYKNKVKAGQVMASAIKSAYDELFHTYADANKKDKETIENYFAPKWGVSAKLTRLMEGTFKQLCELADFEAVPVTEPVTEPGITPTKEVTETPTVARPLTININIQLHLPATEDAAIYDSLFSALKRHFFS